MIGEIAHPGSVMFGVLVCAAGLYLIARLWLMPPSNATGDRRARGVVTVILLAVVGAFGAWNVAFGLTDKPTGRYPAVPLGGYENPAPGNDGSYDCPPGGAPVYVGSNDPANLDGDGDGWGCE